MMCTFRDGLLLEERDWEVNGMDKLFLLPKYVFLSRSYIDIRRFELKSRNYYIESGEESWKC